ncbi:MerR family transcriptional regulator [Parablautia intestinalis]|uniref:MerR family transcriptional regulator n=1 Tax=Parablautia intestinalis TaxID=2320100 RepID=A0A3A9ASR0_9FIRM|nr:helix-turn-helix domain-containing protein [Parablautia intestinalis]RKI89375.1 MerR family transcriptional regulator [Parablautia intestinalis]
MKQAEKIYMISDAAKQIQVEAHVLRYWEEELKIPAKRNEMGHRYYTEEDISKFRRVKELKEQGLQLKAIRQMLKNGNLQGPMLLFENTGNEREKGDGTAADSLQTADSKEEVEMGKRHVVMVKKGEFLPVDEKTMALQEESREQKSFRLQQLLKEMIADAIQSNNQEICQEIKETLLKELDYQFRLQEEREDAREEEIVLKQEEHYQKIDELLRSYNQRGRKIKKTRREKELQKMDYEKKKEEETAENTDGSEEKNKGLKSLFQKKKRSAV